MPDGMLLHLRDIYPIETAWAPKWVGDELRQVRAAAWHARLAGLRAAADADAAQRRGQHDHAAQQARRWPPATRPCTTPTASARPSSPPSWPTGPTGSSATRQQRHLAVAADAELRRRHPGQHFPPLRSAEPEPATPAQRDELTLAAGAAAAEMGQWIKDLAAGHRTFADRLADRQSQMIPSQDPDYGDLGPAFPAWTGPGKDAILQPPKPEIPPSPQVLQRAADRDADYEAAE